MASVTSKRQLEIYECKTDDGGTGLQFGGGPLFMGYDAGDLMRLLGAVFHDGNDEPLDGDLLELAEQYLDPSKAEARRETLRGFDAYDRESELLNEYLRNHDDAWDDAKEAF